MMRSALMTRKMDTSGLLNYTTVYYMTLIGAYICKILFVHYVYTDRNLFMETLYYTYRSTVPLICHLKHSDDAGGANAVTT